MYDIPSSCTFSFQYVTAFVLFWRTCILKPWTSVSCPVSHRQHLRAATLIQRILALILLFLAFSLYILSPVMQLQFLVFYTFIFFSLLLIWGTTYSGSFLRNLENKLHGKQLFKKFNFLFVTTTTTTTK